MIQTTLYNELFSDPTVDLVVFCDVSNVASSIGYVGRGQRFQNKPKPVFTALSR